jgi:hypothetical protein
MPVLKQTRARHILIKTSELVSDAEARRKILADLKERLDHGGDFAELARLHSNDLSASKGRRPRLAEPGRHRAGLRAGHEPPGSRAKSASR